MRLPDLSKVVSRFPTDLLERFDQQLDQAWEQFLQDDDDQPEALLIS